MDSKSEILTNPFDYVGDIQHIRWTNLDIGVQYNIELINHFKAVSYAYKRSGYTKYAALVLKNYDNPEMVKGSVIVIEFPYKCFVRALEALPRTSKLPCLRKDNIGKNLLFSFIKRSDKSLKIVEQTPREPKEELTKKADEILYEREESKR